MDRRQREGKAEGLPVLVPEPGERRPAGRYFAPAYLMGFSAPVSVGYLLYKRRNLWLIGSWMLVGYVWIIAASVPRGDSTCWSQAGPWYTDHFRPGGPSGIPLGASGRYRPGRRSAGALSWVVRRFRARHA